MEEPTLLDQKLPEWTSFDDGPKPLLNSADLKPPWMWDPKFTAGQPNIDVAATTIKFAVASLKKKRYLQR